MATLKLRDENQARNFGLPAEDIDSDVIITHYAERGWALEDIMRHIQAALDAGAHTKQETIYPTRKERVVRGTGGSEEQKG